MGRSILANTVRLWLAMAVLCCLSNLASADILFSTGNPDGKIATLSRPSGVGALETETADDFILGQNALVSGATFTGLLPTGLCFRVSPASRSSCITCFPWTPSTRPMGAC